jgi:SAM-dependent methyltransferase
MRKATTTRRTDAQFGVAMDKGCNKGGVKLYHTCQNYMRRYIVALLASLSLRGGSSIADCGCGSGELALMLMGALARRPKEVLLLEPVPSLLAKAVRKVRRSVKAESSNTPTLVCRSRGFIPDDLPEAWKGRADIVISAQVAMYPTIAQKHAFLAGLGNMVAPGGRMYIAVITQDFAKAKYKRGKRRGEYLIPKDNKGNLQSEFYVNRAFYSRALTKLGFQVTTHTLHTGPEMINEAYIGGDMLGLPIWEIFECVRQD